MSSKVALGEKNTPTIRPTGLIAACVCGAGTVGTDVVAIGNPPPKVHPGGRSGPAFYRPSTLPYARIPEKISSKSDLAGSCGMAPASPTVKNGRFRLLEFACPNGDSEV